MDDPAPPKLLLPLRASPFLTADPQLLFSFNAAGARQL
jgi:hypothetical protein